MRTSNKENTHAKPLEKTHFFLWTILISAFFIPNALAYQWSESTHCDPIHCYSIMNCIDCSGKQSDLDAISNAKTSDISVDMGSIKGMAVTKINSTAMRIDGDITLNQNQKANKWSIASLGIDPFFNQSWNSCRNITITENSGKSFTEYTIPVNLTFLSNDSMYRDVVFVDNSCNNNTNAHQLYHWSEFNSTYDYEWVNISNLLQASSTFNISVYYNASVIDMSFRNINRTFQFVDDFTTGAFDTTKWCSDNFGLYTFKQGDWNRLVIEATANAVATNSLHTCKSYDENATVMVGVNSTNDLYFSWSNDPKNTFSVGANTHFTGLLAYNPNTGDWARIDTGGVQQDLSGIMFTSDFRHITLTQFKNNVSLLGQTANYTVSQIKSFNDAKMGSVRYFKLEQNIGLGWFSNITIRNHTEPEPSIMVSGVQFNDNTSQGNVTPPAPGPGNITQGNITITYFCDGDFSIENNTQGNSTTMTAWGCGGFGCSYDNSIHYVQGRTPIGDKCNVRPATGAMLFFGLIVGLFLMAVLLRWILRKLEMNIAVTIMLLISLVIVFIFVINHLPSQLLNLLGQDMTQNLLVAVFFAVLAIVFL